MKATLKNLIDYGILALTSVVNFLLIYFINLHFPPNLAASLSYTISSGYLIGGLVGLFVLNGLRFEADAYLTTQKLNFTLIFFTALLFLWSPIATIAVMSFARMSLSRNTNINFNYKTSLNIVLTFLGSFLVLLVFKNFMVEYFDPYLMVPYAGASATIIILVLSGRSIFFVPSFKNIVNSKKSYLPTLISLTSRLSYDLVLFTVSLAAITIVKSTLPDNLVSKFFVIYSIMGLSGVIVNAIESKLLGFADFEKNIILVKSIMPVLLISSFTVPFFWLLIVLEINFFISLLAGLAGVVGILIGKEGILLRRSSNAAKILKSSSIMFLLYFCVMIIYLLRQDYVLETFLCFYVMSLWLCFFYLRVVRNVV